MGSEIALMEMFASAARRRYGESALPGAAVQPHHERAHRLRGLARVVGRRGEDGRLALAWPARKATGRGHGEGDAPDDR
jgi:hypothetical protein